MKSIFYLLTILFLSLLISCSEEPPTSVDSEILTKKPPKDPPPPLEPLNLTGAVHIVGGTVESIRNKYRSSFRVWTDFDETPQIREQAGRYIKVAIYDNNGAVELLVYNYSITGKGRNRVEHFELQIWRDGAAPEIYNLDGFMYLDIAIGELDSRYEGDEIVLGGFNMGGGPEIRVYNPNVGFNTPIKTYVSTYGPFGRPVIIGDVAGDAANEIIFDPTRRGLVVLDYNLLGEMEVLGTYATPNNEQLNAIAVGNVEGDGNDEIIWGGNSGEIHILEFNETNSNLEQKWESLNLGSWIHNIAAGDFDGDLEYEIAVATASSENPSSIYVFESSDHSKTLLDEIPEGVISMFAGNANNDPEMRKDLVVGTRTSVKGYYGASSGFDVDIGAIVREIYLK